MRSTITKTNHISNRSLTFNAVRTLLKNNNEFGQSIARLGFTSIFCLYVISKGNTSDLAINIASIYWAWTFILTALIYMQQTESKTRQWIMMLIDMSIISISIHLLNDIGTALLGIYLWVCLGYGLRYGQQLFKGAYIASLLGFGIATYKNPFWLSHPDLKLGFIFTLIFVPVYVLILLLKFEKAKQQADAASEAKSAFLSHISHEIRTPLNGVVVASELLLHTKQDKKQKDLTRMMHASAVSLKKLISDVLDISKIEQGMVELEQVSFNLKTSVEHVHEVFQLEAKRKGLAFNLHIDKNADQYFEGSVGHIEQVLMNLVANAIKFTDQGSIDLFVSANVISNEKDADEKNANDSSTNKLTQIEFKVKDTGIGMSANALNHIFDAFKQADSSITRKYGGTGLGTSIAKQLVKMMRGDITVSSALGVGSLITVTLTLKQAQPQIETEETQDVLVKPQPHENIVKLSTHHKFSKKIRVLIADDNVINRMILIEVLQKNGCIVKAVNDGNEALDALEMHQFDLMILDYNMPGHTGLEVFKIYHSLAGATPVRSVILTADATAKTRDACMDAGVYSVFTKPIITKQINQLVKTYQQERDNIDLNESSNANQSNAAIRLVDKQSNSSLEPLIDQHRMTHLIKLGNGERFLIKLVTEFIESTDLALNQLMEECAELNFEKIHEVAHSLAGESANMGLMPLSKHCRTLMNLTILDTQSITEKLGNVERTYIQSRAQLQAMLKTLSAKSSNN